MAWHLHPLATAEAKIQSTHYTYKPFRRDRTEHEIKTQGKHIHCSCEPLSSVPPSLQLQEVLLQLLQIPPQAWALAPRRLQLRLGLAQLLSARLQLLLCSAQRFFLFQKLNIRRLSLALQMTSYTDKPFQWNLPVLLICGLNQGNKQCNIVFSACC